MNNFNSSSNQNQVSTHDKLTGSRRQFLRSSTACVIAVGTIPTVSSARTEYETLDVNFYIPESSKDLGVYLNNIPRVSEMFLKDQLKGIDVDVSLITDTIIDDTVTTFEDSNEMLDWWKNHNEPSASHSNFLMGMTYDEEVLDPTEGYVKGRGVLGKPYAIGDPDGQDTIKFPNDKRIRSSGASIAVHEIGHNLGVEHKHGTLVGDERTIMSDEDAYTRWKFSDETIYQIKRFLKK